MKLKKLLLVTMIVMIMALPLAACGGTQVTEAPAVEEPVAEEPVAEEPAAEEPEAEEAEVEGPTDLKIAITVLFLEEAWTTGLLQSLERVIEEKPHGLNISYDVLDEVTFAEIGTVLDQTASTGEYDMIWAHSTFYEAVEPLMEEYPDIAWAVAGAGNEALGDNMWYMEITGYESAYLIGVLAGLLTENDNVGTVAEYPFPIMNSLINAYFEGARSVNPDVQTQHAFIESWFDPAKAIESTTAQIANGADFIYSQPIGPIEACMDAGVWCAGSYVDQKDLGPEVVLTSNLILWDSHWNAIIDGWWDHAANGVPYDAPTEAVMFSLAEGGTDIVPIDNMGGAIPAEVIEQVMEVRQQMIDGKLVVEFNPDPPGEFAAEEAEVEGPTDLKIAITVLFLEEAWTTGLLQSLERVIEEKPHGLNISYDVLDEVTFAEIGTVLDQTASTGEYDMIWAHSTFYEAVEPLMEEYPDIAWAVAGAGNEALGDNMWYMEITGYESAYLIGVLAGLLTENDNVGTVAEYPFPIMNSLINAYFEGARSVNPDVQTQHAFIESWFDPAKAIESTTAQIANGADFIYSQPIGPIEACMDAGVWCAGSYVDQKDLGPEVVLTSNLILWDSHWNAIIDGWWDHAANGVPYDAPTEAVMFSLAEGGTDIVPIDDMGGAIPAEVIEKVMEIRQQMIDGTLVVEFNPEAPE